MNKVISNRRIYLELTNRCNLTCPFCPYPVLKSKRKDLDLNLAKKIIAEIIKDVPYRIIYFHNVGEPLLYPQLGELLEYCDRNKVTYGITTNGLLLPEKIKILKGKKIREINISYQVIKEELHGRRGIKMTVDEYRSLILSCIGNLFLEGYSGIIKIKLLTTDTQSRFMGERFRNIQNQTELTKEIGKIYSKFYHRVLNEKQKEKISKINIHLHNKIQIGKSFFVETFPFLNWGNFKQKVWPALFGKCDGIIDQLLISVNGNVSPCCYDVEGDLILGNVKKQSLSQILSSREVKNFILENSSVLIRRKRCRQCLGDFSFERNIQKQVKVILGKNMPQPSKTVIL